MRKFRANGMVLLMLVLLAAALWGQGLADTVTAPVEVQYGQTEARSMLQMINDFRAGTLQDAPSGTTVSGCPWQLNPDGSVQQLEPRAALVYSDRLEDIAMQRAAEIAVYYSHMRPNGQSGLNSLNFDGENIAAGHLTAEDVFWAWAETDVDYQCQGHRRNMLFDRFKSVGIGHAICNGVHYWVQAFSTGTAGGSIGEANDSVCVVDVIVDTDAVHAILPESGMSVYIRPGETMDLKQAVRVRTDADTDWEPNGFAMPATYVSEDPSVVSVDADGIATAVGEGEATVHVAASGGLYEVDVRLIVYTIHFVTSNWTLDFYEDEPGSIIALIEPEGEYMEIWYESSDETVATVDPDGTLHFLKPGIVRINCYYRLYGAMGYSWTVFPLTIRERPSLEGATVTLSSTEMPYTGEEVRPEVRVTLDGYTVSSYCYEVSYTDNIEVGTATVTVTGKNDYKESAEASFQIVPCDLAGAEVIPEYSGTEYDGEEKRPAVEVTLKGRTLTEADYEVSYLDNVQVGTATVTVKGKGNYTGEAKGFFTISPRLISISDAAVMLSQNGFLYTGEEIEPAVTVIVEGLTLTEEDYGIEYRNNVDPGEAIIVLTGKGLYKDTCQRTFAILPSEGEKLPAGLNALGSSAFENTKLEALDLRGTEMRSLSLEAFAGEGGPKTLFLPAEITAISKPEGGKRLSGLWLVFDTEPEIGEAELERLSGETGFSYLILN
ncbi:MAG: CAP domain-containing protein [Clostridia bacterium]|nr:CAP domain-containing protein [Clostridia bacterium]